MTYRNPLNILVIVIIVLSALPLFGGEGNSPSHVWSEPGRDGEEQIEEMRADRETQIDEAYGAIMVELSRSDIVGDLKQWIIFDEGSPWRKSELAMVHKALFHTLHALDDSGLDGQELLKGYRFRRHDGEFVRGDQGLVALVRHDVEEIVLSDVAFLRLDGFSIYHEIGHALDKRLDRELNQHFHQEVGLDVEGEIAELKTLDGFWMRPASREKTQEATADAFAYWVTKDVVGVREPIFAGMPFGVEFEAIDEAMDQALSQARANNQTS